MPALQTAKNAADYPKAFLFFFGLGRKPALLDGMYIQDYPTAKALPGRIG
jgi:hypothetical protein